VLVGTIGAGVPEAVLVAAGVDVVRIVGRPGDPTDVADRYVEPMVGERARSQPQRVLDGTYADVELIVFSREAEAPLRLFYTLREIRRREPERGLPALRLVDFQHLATCPTRRWNEDRVRALCSLLDVDEAALSLAIADCNARRAGRTFDGDRRRVYVAGSAHEETTLAEAVESAGAMVHSTQSLRERLAAFSTLIDRLDSGSWGDTTAPAALNATAATIGAGTAVTPAQLGTSEFIPYEPTPTLRTWDFTNWGTYFSSYVGSLVPTTSAEFVNTLNNMAKHWQRGQVEQACSELGAFARKSGQQAGKKLTSALSADFAGKASRLAPELGC